MLQTLAHEAEVLDSSIHEPQARVRHLAPAELPEKVTPHAAFLQEDEFHPAWSTCYVPGANPAPLAGDHVLKRLYVLDKWLDAFNMDGGAALAHQRAVWTALNNLVGKAHDVLKRDRQQAFGAEYTLGSMAEWYRFAEHPNATLQEIGRAMERALTALRKLLDEEESPPAPPERVQWRRQEETATNYLS